ncbi:hypothetical protein Dimus_039786 [Dionaea muscipula]
MSCFAFLLYVMSFSTQLSVFVRILRSNNACEYFSSQFTSFMTQHNIIHQSFCLDTPPQNGVAQRKNQHLLEVTRALMFQTSVPKMFWSETMLTVVYLINRMPSSVNQGKILYKVIFSHHSPHPLPLRIFGCTCYVCNIRPGLTKLDPKSLRCIFLGYSRIQKGYQCYSPALGRFCISADVVFDDVIPFGSSSPILERPYEFFTVDDVLVYELAPVTSVSPSITTPASLPGPSGLSVLIRTRPTCDVSPYET